MAKEKSKGKSKAPHTRGIIALTEAGVAFETHLYEYDKAHGRSHGHAAAEAVGCEASQMLKTICLEDETGKPLLALMDAEHEVSTKTLARHLGVKSLRPSKPAVVTKHTGYQVGGTSPFGTPKPLPVYVEATAIKAHDMLYINGGARGLIVSLARDDLLRLTGAKPVAMQA